MLGLTTSLGKTENLYTEEVTKVYPDGRREPQEPRRVHFEIHLTPIEDEIDLVTSDFTHDLEDGWFLDEIGLLGDHTFPDEKVYGERVFDCRSVKKGLFTSHRLYFLAFKEWRDSEEIWVPESIWTDDEMQARLERFKEQCAALKR